MHNKSIAQFETDKKKSEKVTARKLGIESHQEMKVEVRPAKKWQIRTVFSLSEDAWKKLVPSIRIHSPATKLKSDFNKIDQTAYPIALESEDDVEAVLTATSPAKLRKSRPDLEKYIKDNTI